MLKILRYSTLALLLVGIFWGIKQFNNPLFRYSYDVCQRKLIFEHKGDIDFMVTGGSVMMMSVRTDEFSKAVSKSTQPRIAYDLSRSWRSEFHSYVFLRDLYDQGRKVKNLIILFYGANDFRYHPHAHIIGKTSDIRGLIHDTHISLTEKIKDYLSLQIQRATYHLSNWIQGTLHNESGDTKAMTSETTDCTLSERQARTVVVDKSMGINKPDEISKANGEQDPDEEMNWDFKNEKNARVLNYLKKIIKLASEHDTKVYFLVPVPFLQKPLSPDFIKEVEDTFHVPLLSPDEAALKNLHKIKYYADVTHMTPEGATLYSQWLAGEILKHEQSSK